MDFGPNSDFVPHSPLSYSNSYAPISPLKNQPNQQINQTRFADQQTSQNGGGNARKDGNKSILKNPSCELMRPRNSGGGNGGNFPSLSQSEKKPAQAPLARKDSLKTVAFGLTTNLDDTVMGKDGKGKNGNNNRMKTVIFSHEAQSLHRLITTQKEEIDALKRVVADLTAAEEQRRGEGRELMNIIADLSSRLFDVEKRQRRPFFDGEVNGDDEKTMEEAEETRDDWREENDENEEDGGKAGVRRTPNMENKQQRSNPQPKNDARNNGGKRVLGQKNITIANNDEATKKREKYKVVSGNNPAAAPANEKPPPALPVTRRQTNGEPNKREEFLQRLNTAMQSLPRFEERLHSVYRLWATEDSATSPANNRAAAILGEDAISGFNRDEESVGPSEMHMVRRTITQHQEEVRFISASPGRYNNNGRRQQPMFARQNARTKPIIEPLDDDDGEEGGGEHNLETMPNIRRSEHCTDEAEFFQQEEEAEDGGNYAAHEEMDGRREQQQRRGGNFHDRTLPSPTTHHPFLNRRRQREANSTIRNRYK